MSEGRFARHAYGLVPDVERCVSIDEGDDVLGGTVVVGEKDGRRGFVESLLVAGRKVAKKVNGRSTKAIKTLVVIPNDNERTRTRSSELEIELLLHEVRVLVFIDENNLEIVGKLLELAGTQAREYLVF